MTNNVSALAISMIQRYIRHYEDIADDLLLLAPLMVHQQITRNGYMRFSVHSLSSTGSLQWRNAKRQPAYYLVG